MAKHTRAGLSALETLGAAVGSGALMGRYGSMELFGVPATAVLGAALHAAGFWFDMEDAHALGNGFLATYAVTLGAGLGDRIAVNVNKAGKWPGVTPTSFTNHEKAKVGALPSAQAPMTTSELESMASAVTSR